MKKENSNMDKVFRDKLNDLKVEPPNHIWEDIQGQLASQNGTKPTILYRWIAVAAILVLAFVAGWYYNIILNEEQSQIAGIETLESEEKSPVIKKHEEDTSSSIERTDLSPKAEGLQIASARQGKYVSDLTKKEIIRETEREDNTFTPTVEINLDFINSLKANIKFDKQVVSLAGKGKSEIPSFRHLKNYTAERVTPFNEAVEESSKWKVGLHVSPGYSSYSASYDANYANNMTYPAGEGKGNVSGGMSVQYKPGKRWSLESGVYYAQNGQKSESSPQSYRFYSETDNYLASSEKFYFNPEVDVVGEQMAMNSVAGIIEFEDVPEGTEFAVDIERTISNASTLLTSGEFSQIFDFIEIPLLLRYLVFDSKIDVELVGGLNAGLVVGNKAFLNNEYGLQDIGKTRDISTVNLSGTMGVGITYALNRNVSLAVEPRLNYYINSINRNPDVDYKPYRVGVYTGLYYAF